MGNSQSMDKVQHVVKEGINIYKKVKAEQEQQQHNGSNNNNHYNQDSNDYNHHSGGGSSYHPSADNDDDEEYAQLRAQAHEEAQKRNDCYARSQEAYKNGDGAEGKVKKKNPEEDNRVLICLYYMQPRNYQIRAITMTT